MVSGADWQLRWSPWAILTPNAWRSASIGSKSRCRDFFRTKRVRPDMKDGNQEMSALRERADVEHWKRLRMQTSLTTSNGSVVSSNRGRA